MARPLRILLIVIAAVVVVLGLAVAAFAMFFDANRFRGEITAQVEQRTGRKLTIGDIHLSIYPVLGARLRDVALDNAAGFGDQPFAQVGEAEVGVALFPLLFDHSVQVKQLRLVDARFALAKNADGKTNWDDLLKAGSSGSGASTPNPSAPSDSKTTSSIDIAGIDIKNAAVSYADLGTHQQYEVDALNASVGKFEYGQPFDFKLSFTTKAAEPAFVGDVALSGKAMVDPATKRYALSGAELAIEPQGKGPLSGGAKLSFSAQADLQAGTLAVTDGHASAADLKADFSLKGQGLGSDQLSFGGPLSIAPFSPREVLAALGHAPPDTADKDALKQASLSATLQGSAKAVMLRDLKLTLDQSHISGEAGIADLKAKQAVFTLSLDQLDADRYLPPAAAKPAKKAGKSDDKAGDDAPLPFDALDSLNAEGSLSIGQFKLHGVKMSDAVLRLRAAPGWPKRLQLSSKLYRGTLESTTTLTPPSAPPRVAQSLRLQDVDIGPLLTDLNGSTRLQGHGNISADLTATGRTAGALKRALNGKLSAALRDGAFKGANLAQMIRQGQSGLAGQIIAANADSAKQTDFSEMSLAATITNGVMHLDALDAKSPAFRLDGSGSLDLVHETIDLLLKPTIVRSLEGQGAQDTANLEGLVIPVKVGGTFAAPSISFDLREALRQRAADKLRGRLEQGRERLLNRLFGAPPSNQQNQDGKTP